MGFVTLGNRLRQKPKRRHEDNKPKMHFSYFGRIFVSLGFWTVITFSLFLLARFDSFSFSGFKRQGDKTRGLRQREGIGCQKNIICTSPILYSLFRDKMKEHKIG